MSSGALYVLDTNVLFNWVLSYVAEAARLGCGEREKLTASRRFCEERSRDILVPGVVWAELHGVFLHKDIVVEHYRRWHRDRKTALRRIYSHVWHEDAHIRLGDNDFDLDLVTNISCHEVPKRLVQEVIERLRRSRRTETGGLRKLLDGMDAAVLASAWAAAGASPHRVVYLVSDDWGLGAVLRALRGEKICGQKFPANLRDHPLINRGRHRRR